MEKYTNNPVSTLNGSINNSVTSLVVNSASSFPTTGTFSILIDTEIMKVTAVSGTTFTIVRGQEGTTPASHTSGVAVDGTLTARSMDQIAADQIIFDSYANLPTASKKGRLFIPSDGGFQLYDDGAAWNGFDKDGPKKSALSYSWSWDNQGGATVTARGTDIVLESNGAIGGSNAYALRYKTQPTPPYTIIAEFCYNWDVGNGGSFTATTIGWRNSSSGKLHLLVAAWNSGAVTIYSIKQDNSTTFNATYSTAAIARVLDPVPKYLFIRDDGTNRRLGVSYDGQLMRQTDFQTNTNFFTADQVFFGIRNDGTDQSGTVLRSWLEF